MNAQGGRCRAVLPTIEAARQQSTFVQSLMERICWRALDGAMCLLIGPDALAAMREAAHVVHYDLKAKNTVIR